MSLLSPEENVAKVNAYNNFFRLELTTDNNIIPPLRQEYQPALMTQALQTLVSLIYRLILALKKVSGPNNMPNEFLKRYVEWCSRYIGIIFRK